MFKKLMFALSLMPIVISAYDIPYFNSKQSKQQAKDFFTGFCIGLGQGSAYKLIDHAKHSFEARPDDFIVHADIPVTLNAIAAALETTYCQRKGQVPTSLLWGHFFGQAIIDSFNIKYDRKGNLEKFEKGTITINISLLAALLYQSLKPSNKGWFN